MKNFTHQKFACLIFLSCIIKSVDLPETILFKDINDQLINFRTNRLKTSQQQECFKKVFGNKLNTNQPITLPFSHDAFAKFINFCAGDTQSKQNIENSFGDYETGLAILAAIGFITLKRKHEESEELLEKKHKIEIPFQEEKIVFQFPEREHIITGELAQKLKSTYDSVPFHLFNDLNNPKTLYIPINFEVDTEVLSFFQKSFLTLNTHYLIRDRITDAINENPSLKFIQQQIKILTKAHQLADFLDLRELNRQLKDALLYTKHIQEVLGLEELLKTNISYENLLMNAQNSILLYFIEPQTDYSGSTFTITTYENKAFQTITNTLASLYDFFSDGISFALRHNKKKLAFFLFDILQKSTDPYMAATSILIQFSDAELPLTLKSLDLRYFVTKINIIASSNKDVDVIEQYINAILFLLNQLGLSIEEILHIKNSIFIHWHISLPQPIGAIQFYENNFKKGLEENLNRQKMMYGLDFLNYQSATIYLLYMRINNPNGSYSTIHKNTLPPEEQLKILKGRFAID